MPQRPASSLEMSQILVRARKHRTALNVWITASPSLSSLHLNIHCTRWAKLWVQPCKDRKVATFQSWKLKAGLDMCAGQICGGQGRCRPNLDGLARSSTTVTLAVGEHSPHHASGTKKSQQAVAVLPSPGGCRAAWASARRCGTLAGPAGWGCEKVAHQVPST